MGERLQYVFRTMIRLKLKTGLGECQVISVAEGNHFQFQYGASSKNRNRNRNSLNKHFTSKTYGDELVFDQIK